METVGDDMAVMEMVVQMFHAMRANIDFPHWTHRFHTDSLFVAQMAFCNRLGMPHSQFLEWDPVDQEKALAYETFERARCHECGIHPDDWPEETSLDQEDPMEVVATRCYGCVALGDWLDAYKESYSVNGEVDPRAMRGIRPRLVPRRGEVEDGW